jgi:hypothetical protein
MPSAAAARRNALRAPIPTKQAGRCWVSVQSSRATRHQGLPAATG